MKNAPVAAVTAMNGLVSRRGAGMSDMLQAATIRTALAFTDATTFTPAPSECCGAVGVLSVRTPALQHSDGDGYSGRGSLGRPSTRSPVMLRWIWLVPPQIVSEREKKNDEIIGLTG